MSDGHNNGKDVGLAASRHYSNVAGGRRCNGGTVDGRRATSHRIFRSEKMDPRLFSLGSAPGCSGSGSAPCASSEAAPSEAAPSEASTLNAPPVGLSVGAA
eukprot:CAMPEP_0195572420 /NCGR_PEP_ID=MMETSP0814-20130614/4722_1 /TAXON_ID=97485 /ORGANISM="Prymnesium parvum, Strain Texoma1" /LENGTH=100 /DNA_ID=CAMNT_0040708181 /DNA_START=134 /DNA_END=433 /DNA_ORIENTATION=-